MLASLQRSRDVLKQSRDVVLRSTFYLETGVVLTSPWLPGILLNNPPTLIVSATEGRADSVSETTEQYQSVPVQPN